MPATLPSSCFIADEQTTPAHLQFWSNRHAELHRGKRKQQPDQTTEDDSNATKPDSIQSSGASKATQYSYSDLTKKCCYLCARQFKAEAEVHKHERLSQLHKDNLKNEDLKLKAVAKMTKAGLQPRPVVVADEDTTSPEYRDRAKERRQAFGGSKKISLPMKKPGGQAGAQAASKAEPAAAAAPAPNKGAALLGKMGWTTGAGLGAQGTGSTAPIATEMYAEGVGLGAQGGKMGDAAAEAERNTTGSYAEFLERTKDKAKQRYESMG